MVDGPMREATEREVVLPDMKYEAFCGFLEFLYTDTVVGLAKQTTENDVSLEFALDLLAASDQYLVEDLKSLCENAIQNSITVQNVAMMLATADSRQVSILWGRFVYIVLLSLFEIVLGEFI